MHFDGDQLLCPWTGSLSMLNTTVVANPDLATPLPWLVVPFPTPCGCPDGTLGEVLQLHSFSLVLSRFSNSRGSMEPHPPLVDKQAS